MCSWCDQCDVTWWVANSCCSQYCWCFFSFLNLSKTSQGKEFCCHLLLKFIMRRWRNILFFFTTFYSYTHTENTRIQYNSIIVYFIYFGSFSPWKYLIFEENFPTSTGIQKYIHSLKFWINKEKKMNKKSIENFISWIDKNIVVDNGYKTFTTWCLIILREFSEK